MTKNNLYTVPTVKLVYKALKSATKVKVNIAIGD